MKISDVKGERSFTISKDVMPYIVKFSKNKYFKTVFDVGGLPEDPKERGEIIAAKIADNLPDLISSCKDDLVGYFALLENITPKEYLETVTVEKVFDGILDMFRDEHFKTFFIPLLKKPLTGKG